jgi:class 3 adenylate cyclase
VITTVLTIYALFGDDFRLLVTYQNLDDMFNAVTITCILVFVVEIIVASIGKADYFFSFFFALDVISTATLFLDLTWVNTLLFCADAEGGSVGETGKTAKTGSRAGRTVRIIRLMRLVKLYAKYKAAMEDREKKQGKVKKRTKRAEPGGSEGEDDHEFQTSDTLDSGIPGSEGRNSTESLPDGTKPSGQPQAETRVGKKLGDMTTRRVILLVLVMLFCMPQFNPASWGLTDFQTSMDIGMEVVYDRFRHWCMSNTTGSALPWCLQSELVFSGNAPSAEQARKRQLFEDFLLELVYTHQGFQFSYSLYWVGIQSKALNAEIGESSAGQLLGDLAYLGQERFVGASGIPVADWDSRYANPAWITEVPPIPQSTVQRLTSTWIENCLGTFWGTPLGEQLSEPSGSKCSIKRDLRCSEVAYMAPSSKTSSDTNNFNMLFAFNTRSTTTMEAGLNMLQTVFICLCVGVGAMTFSNDADKLLLKPIERMIAKMETIKDNPLEAMRLGDMEFRREEIENAKRKEQLAELNRFQKLWHALSTKKNVKEPMETVILEKTIIKLGGLLALGFGEAGAEIIGHNMGHSAGVDAMVPGSRVEAIFGFCSIHNFLVVNQVLKEKVMIFVNQIGEIVHGCVDDFNGAPNKNIGDSFLLIWRISGYEERGQQKLADMAIMSFVRIITELNKSPVLAQYRQHPGILQRIPQFRVSMGYGLHCGWAIEGAIGSDFKIDASYLSPNVNVAALLDAATSDFEVWILMSHLLMNLCSKEVAMMCRLIDHIVVEGARQPLRIFTIDLDYMSLPVKVRTGVKYIKNRFKIRQIREIWKQEKWSEDYNVCDAFEMDEEVALMREAYSPEFFRRFATGYRNYETGNWKVARDLLFTCYYSPRSDVGAKPWVHEDEWPRDGPTRSLLKFMEKSDFTAPPDWPGYRYMKPGDKLF